MLIPFLCAIFLSR